MVVSAVLKLNQKGHLLVRISFICLTYDPGLRDFGYICFIFFPIKRSRVWVEKRITGKLFCTLKWFSIVQASARFTAASIVLLGLSSLFNDVAFYWLALIFFLQRGPIAPLSEEITDPDQKYVTLGILVLFLGLLVCLPYPFPFADEVISSF